MLPRVIKAKYQLSYAQMALLLGKDVRTIERYCASDRVPDAIQNYCWLLDFYLMSTNQLPPYAMLLQSPLEVQA